LFDQGFSSIDIITTIFRVTRNSQIPEFLKLEYLRVGALRTPEQRSYDRSWVALLCALSTEVRSPWVFAHH